MMAARFNVTVVASVNDERVLGETLLKSPMIADGCARVIVETGHSCAGSAYNAGLRRATTEYVVFAHQDIYFPSGWEARLQSAIEKLDSAGKHWGVLGVWGIQANGRFAGQVWCTGGNREHAGDVSCINEVVSVDEIVIVMRRSSGLAFDENLPGFHLYGTDIILQARARGMGAFVFHGPVIHNSKHNPNYLDRRYRVAYHYMRKKWSFALPLTTCIIPITRHAWPLYRGWLRLSLRNIRNLGRIRMIREDASALAVRLGYESDPPATPSSSDVISGQYLKECESSTT